jgi:hypothetical protein
MHRRNALLTLAALAVLCIVIATPVYAVTPNEVYTFNEDQIYTEYWDTLDNSYSNFTVTVDFSNLHEVSAPTNDTAWFLVQIANPGHDGWGISWEHDTVAEGGQLTEYLYKYTNWTKTGTVYQKNVTSYSKTVTFQYDGTYLTVYSGASQIYKTARSGFTLTDINVAGHPQNSQIAGYIVVTIANYSRTAPVTTAMYGLVGVVIALAAVGICVGYIKKF